MKAHTPDIAVVGGGLVGLCSALALQRAGLSTLLIEPARVQGGASFGNAGHVAVEQVEPLANPKALRSAPGRLFALGGPLDFRLGAAGAWGGWALRYLAASTPTRAAAGADALGRLLGEATPAWRRLVATLERPDLLVEDGHLVVWEDRARAAAGRAHWRSVRSGPAKVRDLSARERTALEAALARPFADAVGFDGTAQVDSPAEACRALSAAFLLAGGEHRVARVQVLPLQDGRAGVALEGGGTLWPAQVVVAAGVGSGPLLRGIGHAAPVVAERGYHIEAETDGWEGLAPVVFEDRAVVVTRFGSRLRATSFVEFAGPASPPDPRKWRRLERHAAELGLPLRGPVSRWMGARPTLPDYLPAIGRSGRATNLITAFGHQHLGLTLAPLTGELVAAVALGRTPAVPLEPYDVTRFDRSGGAR